MTSAQLLQGGIVVEHVSRSFGQVRAVRDASFTALPGTVTALIGPNGSGKTTLMLMLASLLRPDGGSIRIAGFDPMDATPEVRSRLGWMPDVLGSWANLSVRSTLEFTARMYRMDRSAAARRAAELVTLVDLTELADSPTRVLSRGQKQRLSLARCLVHAPLGIDCDGTLAQLDAAETIALGDELVVAIHDRMSQHACTQIEPEIAVHGAVERVAHGVALTIEVEPHGALQRQLVRGRLRLAATPRRELE